MKREQQQERESDAGELSPLQERLLSTPIVELARSESACEQLEQQSNGADRCI
jgi:hypothetical protein